MITPVAIIIFNRPELTQRVFSVIAKVKPNKLFVIADGPRQGDPGDEARCRATRSIFDQVDWDCEVTTNYSETNLGVGLRPASGLQWLFGKTEQAIVLEDDCVPHQTFFRYCDELLDKYRDDERIMHISGDNWNFGRTESSYFFSDYCYSCGWASWQRAFRHYDPELKLWPELRETSWMQDILGDADAVEFWKSKFDLFYQSGIEKTGWDWPWLFACWANRGLSIIPAVNLICNTGFGPDATHTKRADDARSNIPAVEMSFPLRHPNCMIRNGSANRLIVEQVGLRRSRRTLYHWMRRKCLDALPASVRKKVSALRSNALDLIRP